MKDLIIIGASGFGREVAWLVERANRAGAEWNLLGFLDDDEGVQGTAINGYPVLGTVSESARYPEASLVCAIGSASVRERVVARLVESNPSVRFATLVDPTVEMSNYVEVGEGSIICAHTIVTTNVAIGRHVIINLDCTVGHDAVLHDFVTLYPSVNVSGITDIGRCSEMGTGSAIIQTRSVGESSIVGAGAVVVRDVPARCTAVGSPAKPIKFHG